jgi:hypothetical protein
MGAALALYGTTAHADAKAAAVSKLLEDMDYFPPLEEKVSPNPEGINLQLDWQGRFAFSVRAAVTLPPPSRCHRSTSAHTGHP